MTTPDTDRVIDQRIDRVVPLTTPALLHHHLPLDAALADAVLAGRRAVGRVLDRADDRLLVVVGPCSVHDPAAALEYAGRLREVADRLADDLLVVMRVYFEKPRSTVGWKGLINDPALDGSGDVNSGLRTARALLLDPRVLPNTARPRRRRKYVRDASGSSASGGIVIRPRTSR